MINNLIAGAETNTEITNPILGDLGGKTGISFFQSFIPNLISLAFILGVIIFFFILIIGAIQWISSGGDKQAVENARGKVTNAIIGLVILFTVYAIIQLINIFFGVKLLELTLPTLTGS
jgi:hypothetical protein